MSATDAPPAGLASVVVPCFDQLGYTRHCVAALARHTRRPWELVAVDNGSTDGTAAYLAGVADAGAFPVVVVTNPENRGFPAACNQGLKAARGDHLVLLNNDAVVTDGWLDQLAALAESDPRIGMTGPVSNYAPPPQLVEGADYPDLDAMHRFAARWRAGHRGKWLTAGKLSGFCLLLKRRVYEAVGGLDEGFGLGFFDDDDLAVRVTRAGFTMAVAYDLFVHHFGSRTFAGSGVDAGALLQENAGKFAAKWGTEAGAPGRAVTLTPWAPPAAGPAARPRVSLTMIVRDEEANLPACLASAEGLFDEVVVVDTGSADRTAEVARSFGARVFDFVWVDDFAAARNAALARAAGDYAFWLDADDVIDPPQREKLKALLDGLRAGDEAAYVVRCACDPDRGGGGGETVVDHVRLFPLREDVRWEYRVHEQILPALRRAGVPVRWTDATVRHTGYADPALRSRKLARDEAILTEDLGDRPGDPFVLFNLGSIAVERRDWRAALGHLTASLRGSAPADSITRKLFALIARAHQMLGETDRALAACAAGLGADPDDAELLFREAVIRRNAGDRGGAEACWRRVLTLARPERFASVDPGIYGHLTARNLAALAEERGDRGEALRLWGRVLAERPGDGEAVGARHRLGGPTDPGVVPWLVPGSTREVVPARGPGDFDPYVPLAAAWVEALAARVVVELGVRAGVSTRALLAGAHATGGRVWGVDPEDRHGIDDPAFTFVRADAAAVADRWEVIDLLHVDTDPHTEEQTRRWLELYAGKCRAVALHDAHHPGFGVGAAVRAFAAAGGWRVYEYWGNPSGWAVLTRPGEPCPRDEGLPP